MNSFLVQVILVFLALNNLILTGFSSTDPCQEGDGECELNQHIQKRKERARERERINELFLNARAQKKNQNENELNDIQIDLKEIDLPPCESEKNGWKCDWQSRFGYRNGKTNFCDFPVIEDPFSLTFSEFQERFKNRSPVLLKTSLNDWTPNDGRHFSRTRLIERYGDMKFETGRSHRLVLNSGIGYDEMKLSEYLDKWMAFNRSNDQKIDGSNEPIYIFDRSIWKKNDSTFQKELFVSPFEFLRNDLIDDYGIFLIGGTGSGASFHGHGETWLALAHGRKRWFVYPPSESPAGGFWPAYAMVDWVDRVYSKLPERRSVRTLNKKKKKFDKFEWISEKSMLIENQMRLEDIHPQKPFECIQMPGDIVYLPEFWSHGVLNIGDVVGGAIQASHSYGAFVTDLDRVSGIESYLNNPSLTDLQKRSKHLNLLGIHAKMMANAPLNPIHYFFNGYERRLLGDEISLKFAIKFFENALKMDPFYTESMVELARLYRSEQFKLIANESENGDAMAERVLRQAFLKNPRHPSVIDELAALFNEYNRSDFASLVQNHLDLPEISMD